MNSTKHTILTFLLAIVLGGTQVHAQENAMLRGIVGIVGKVQKNKGSARACNAAVESLVNLKTRVTLLDEVSNSPNEYRGKQVEPFHLNAIFSRAYDVRNGTNALRGKYYDGRQAGIHYAAIEKMVKPKTTAEFTFDGHAGRQELVVIPYDSKAAHEVTVFVNGKPRSVKSHLTNPVGLYWILDGITKQSRITIRITNKSHAPQSFALINYNPQK